MLLWLVLFIVGLRADLFFCVFIIRIVEFVVVVVGVRICGYVGFFVIIDSIVVVVGVVSCAYMLT